MKRFLLVFVTILLTSCSFDNKTGIWKDASSIPVENKNAKSISKKSSTTRLENVFIKNQVFNKEIDVKNTFNIQIDSPIKISNWV